MAQTIDLTSLVSGVGQGSGLPWDRSSPWFILKKRLSIPDLTDAGYTVAADTYQLFDLPLNVCVTAAWINVITAETTNADATLCVGDTDTTNGFIIAQTCASTGVRGYVHDSTTGAAFFDGDTTAANGRWYTGMDSEVASDRIVVAVANEAFTELVVDIYIMGFNLV